MSSFSSIDFDSAMQKLSYVATHFDPANFETAAIHCTPFEAHLTAFEFKSQLEKSFRCQLTAAEVSKMFFPSINVFYRCICSCLDSSVLRLL